MTSFFMKKNITLILKVKSANINDTKKPNMSISNTIKGANSSLTPRHTTAEGLKYRPVHHVSRLDSRSDSFITVKLTF